jgi:hypothetical protein
MVVDIGNPIYGTMKLKRILVYWILLKTNLKVGIPLNDTFSTKWLEIFV